MNKKGFTLIELLAVIVILSLLIVLSGVAVTRVTKKSKNDLCKIQAKSIKKAAESWYADNMFDIENGKNRKLGLEELKKYGLPDQITNPKSGTTGEINVKITLDNDGKVSYYITIDGDTCDE